VTVGVAVMGLLPGKHTLPVELRADSAVLERTSALQIALLDCCICKPKRTGMRSSATRREPVRPTSKYPRDLLLEHTRRLAGRSCTLRVGELRVPRFDP
jgi:hypothetical protein